MAGKPLLLKLFSSMLVAVCTTSAMFEACLVAEGWAHHSVLNF